MERGIGAFGAGGEAGATVWAAVGAAALDKGAAVTAAANVTTGGLTDLVDEWRHATAAAIGVTAMAARGAASMDRCRGEHARFRRGARFTAAR